MQFTLPDMSCGHCVKVITQAITALDAQARVQADVASKTVQVESERLSTEQVAAALAEAGYTPA